MAKLLIKGGKKLEGEIRVAGMKNAATPIMAASLLAGEKCVIENVPDISDVRTMADILRSLGAGVEFKNNTITILPSKLSLKNLDVFSVKKLRSSILLLGPLAVILGKISLPEPGGCIIGKRPIDTHIYVLEKLGAKIKLRNGNIELNSEELRGAEIVMPEFSVTATENVIMAATLAKGKTVLRLAAFEPHVEDLCDFLNKMGARITLGLRNTIIIEGVSRLSGANHSIIPDNIEAGTFAVAGLVTGGKVKLKGVRHEHLDAVYSLLERAGATIDIKNNSVAIYAKSALRGFKLQTLPYPGFPTDLQAPFGLLATQCEGVSVIHDPLYEGRLGYIRELEKMGAGAVVCDLHRAVIFGPSKLCGAIIKGLDLRAGATLVLAGLAAKGETIVEGVENLDRGYEHFDERLRKLGADIKRIEKSI